MRWLTGLLGYVLVLSVLALASPPARAQDFKPSSVTTNPKSLDRKQLDDLVQKMGQKSTPEAEQRLLVGFFSLNRADVEYVLAKMRARAAKSAAVPGRAKNTEAQLAATVVELNDLSMEKFKVPFHLALARGEQLPGDELLQKNTRAAAAAAGGAVCPLGTYSGYVGRKLLGFNPYFSPNINAARRVEDVGCNLAQGPYQTTVKYWHTVMAQVSVFVWMQGWNGNLATGGNKFFYKAWLVPLASTSISQLALGLWAKN